MNAKKYTVSNSHAEVAAWALGLSAVRAAAGAALVSVIVACSPAGASRSAEESAPQDTLAAAASRAFEYFPAQYVNQATEVSPHIEAF